MASRSILARRSDRWHGSALSLILMVVAILAVTLPNFGSIRVTRMTNGQSDLHLALVNNSTPLLQPSEVNSTVAGIYSWMAGNASAPISSWPSQPAVDAAILTDYAALNATQTFQSLVAKWGTSNFTFEASYTNSSGVTNGTFDVHWISKNGTANQTNDEYWLGNVCLNQGLGPSAPCQQLTGPFVATGADVQSCACSYNWAGYTMWTPNHVTLSYVSQWTVVKYASVPPQVPNRRGQTVDAAFTVWDAISPGSGGQNMVQTGYVADVTNPSSAQDSGYYGMLWWASLGGGISGYHSDYYPRVVASPGNILWLGVYNLGHCGWWWNCARAQVYDYNLQAGRAVGILTNNGYSPRYAMAIAEAPTWNSVIQQIPSWSGSITNQWWPNLVMTNGNSWNTNSLIQMGDDYQTTIGQNCGPASTGESWNGNNAQSSVTWSTSAYDYYCV
jgi:hypothetical protein